MCVGGVTVTWLIWGRRGVLYSVYTSHPSLILSHWTPPENEKYKYIRLILSLIPQSRQSAKLFLQSSELGLCPP